MDIQKLRGEFFMLFLQYHLLEISRNSALRDYDTACYALLEHPYFSFYISDNTCLFLTPCYTFPLQFLCLEQHCFCIKTQHRLYAQDYLTGSSGLKLWHRKNQEDLRHTLLVKIHATQATISQHKEQKQI